MRTLITEVIPHEEGIDNTNETKLPVNISWELRFYCDVCDTEIAEDETESHVCEDDK